MRERYKQMVAYCRNKITGEPDDSCWEELARHWERLADEYEGQAQQHPQAKPQDDK